MKIKLFKLYTTSIFLFVTIISFAQPGSNTGSNDLETTDTPAASINDYIWVLAVISFIYVFAKLKDLTCTKQEI